MSPLETLGFALGTSFASGLNLYATVAAAGLFQRLGIVTMPEPLAVLAHPVVIGVAITLFVVEFIADKIPYVDSLWDSVHTVIRPTIAAILGVLIAGDASSLEQAFAATGASVMALLSHLAKGGLRLAVNTSPEPVTNVGTSLAEDGAVVGVTLLAWQFPWIAAAIALVLLAVGLGLAFFLLRRIRRGWARVRHRFT